MSTFIYVVRIETEKGDYEDVDIRDDADDAWEVYEHYKTEYPSLGVWVQVHKLDSETRH